MRLLLDQNLSRRLVESLRDSFDEVIHVCAAGLDHSDDRAIWEYAKNRA